MAGVEASKQLMVPWPSPRGYKSKVSQSSNIYLLSSYFTPGFLLEDGDTVMTETDMGPAHVGNTISQMAAQKDGDWFLLNHGQLMNGDTPHKAKNQKPTEKNIYDLYYVNKDPSSQSYDFSSGHVWMWELDYKESWALKNWCFWTVGLEKTLESPLDCKEIQPVHPKGDQFWVFIGRIDFEAETPIFWPPVVKSSLIWKDPDAGKD